MREIKFRVWVKSKNKMLPVRQTHYGSDGCSDTIVVYPANSKNGYIVGNSCEVMQFTGLLDKNGKEIYEGDILAVTNPNGEKDLWCLVEYDSRVGGYEYTPESGYGDFDTSTIGWAMGMEFEFEIIGNIHENPELLKEANE